MSRIGNKPIAIPAGVEVAVDGQNVTVKGPKGTLTREIRKEIGVKVEGNEIVVSRFSENKTSKSLHGLSRTLIANMVEGATNGYSKTLEVQGVGYRVQKQGSSLVMNLGFSHQVVMNETDTIKIEVPDPNTIVVSGADKQEVGQFAAEIREKRTPEPYKGKGIRYKGEYVRRKEGKAGKK